MGTLPFYLYKKDICKEAFERGIYTDPQSSNSSNENEIDNYSDNCVENEDIEEEYDTDSEEEYMTENSVDDTAFFIIGRSTRYSRQIKVNNRIFTQAIFSGWYDPALHSNFEVFQIKQNLKKHLWLILQTDRFFKNFTLFWIFSFKV